MNESSSKGLGVSDAGGVDNLEALRQKIAVLESRLAQKDEEEQMRECAAMLEATLAEREDQEARIAELEAKLFEKEYNKEEPKPARKLTVPGKNRRGFKKGFLGTAGKARNVEVAKNQLLEIAFMDADEQNLKKEIQDPCLTHEERELQKQRLAELQVTQKAFVEEFFKDDGLMQYVSGDKLKAVLERKHQQSKSEGWDEPPLLESEMLLESEIESEMRKPSSEQPPKTAPEPLPDLKKGFLEGHRLASQEELVEEMHQMQQDQEAQREHVEEERERFDAELDEALENAERDLEQGRQIFLSARKIEKLSKKGPELDTAYMKKLESCIECWEEGMYQLEDFDEDFREDRQAKADEMRCACGGNLVLAYIQYGDDHLENALTAINEVLAYTPRHAKSLYRRAQVFQKMRKLREAEEDLTLAKEIDPKNKDITKALKELKRAIKDRQQAQKCREETVAGQIRQRREAIKNKKHTDGVYEQCAERIDYGTCFMLNDYKWMVNSDGTVSDWAPNQTNGGRGSDYYVWSQTLSRVDIYVKVGGDDMGKNVIVDINTNSLHVSAIEKDGSKRPVMGGELHEPVKPADSFWETERPGFIYIALRKLHTMSAVVEKTCAQAQADNTEDLLVEKRKWWNRVIVGDLTVKTEGFRINETDFNDADRIKSAKRMRQIMKEGKSVSEDAAEQKVISDRETKKLQQERERKRLAEQTPEQIEQKKRQDEIIKGFSDSVKEGKDPSSVPGIVNNKARAPSPPPGYGRDSDSDSDFDEDAYYNEVPQNRPPRPVPGMTQEETQMHMNTIQRNFQARMARVRAEDEAIESELSVEAAVLERQLAEERKNWI